MSLHLAGWVRSLPRGAARNGTRRLLTAARLTAARSEGPASTLAGLACGVPFGSNPPALISEGALVLWSLGVRRVLR